MNTQYFIVLGCIFLTCSSLFAQPREATLLDHKDRIRITPVDVLNSPFRETNLSVSPDGNYLYFMSLRGGQPWSDKGYNSNGTDSTYDGDIWVSKKKNGAWQAPECLPYGINTSKGEDEPNISPGGTTIYFQSWRDSWEGDGGPYFKAKIKDGKIGAREGLGGGITEFFIINRYVNDATDGMSISPNGRVFVVARGRGYYRNMDIYISKKGPNGWSFCRRLDISTYGNERSVFIAPDGKTLYFASDGYEGFGGLDIYKTTLHADGTTGEVINIGKPFNTPGDDYNFVLTGDGKEGYFTRNGDIYFADLTEADEKMKPIAGISLKGTVKDSLSRLGLQANVIIMDARTKRVYKKFITSKQGTFYTHIPNQDGVYDMVAMRDGYIQSKRRLRIQKTVSQQSYETKFLLSKKRTELVVIPDDPVIPAEVRRKEKEEEVKPGRPQKEIPDLNGLAEVKPDPKKEIKPIDTPTIDINPQRINDPYSFTGIAENNLVLLIDVSKSMGTSDRLPLLQASLKKLIGHMRAEDRISIVTYSSNAAVVLDGLSAAKQMPIFMAIDDLKTAGGTRSRSALKRAFKVAGNHFIEGGNNRIILATDGNFDITELYGPTQKGAEKGVSLSIFSFGKMGKERTQNFDNLSEKGKGNHANITLDNVDDALLREAKAVQKEK